MTQSVYSLSCIIVMSDAEEVHQPVVICFKYFIMIMMMMNEECCV